jgi:hypothetical protein
MSNLRVRKGGIDADNEGQADHALKAHKPDFSLGTVIQVSHHRNPSAFDKINGLDALLWNEESLANRQGNGGDAAMTIEEQALRKAVDLWK